MLVAICVPEQHALVIYRKLNHLPTITSRDDNVHKVIIFLGEPQLLCYVQNRRWWFFHLISTYNVSYASSLSFWVCPKLVYGPPHIVNHSKSSSVETFVSQMLWVRTTHLPGYSVLPSCIRLLNGTRWTAGVIYICFSWVRIYPSASTINPDLSVLSQNKPQGISAMSAGTILPLDTPFRAFGISYCVISVSGTNMRCVLDRHCLLLRTLRNRPDSCFHLCPANTVDPPLTVPTPLVLVPLAVV